MAAQIQHKLFSVTDYAKMRESGILTEEDRVELIGGEVRSMTPIGPLHAAIVNRLNALFTRILNGTVIVSIQNPLRLNDYTEPQPDLLVLRWRADFYATDHPSAADVLLVIEVADTSAEYDRGEKLPRYVEAGIPEVWLVDVPNQVVEQHTQPRNRLYSSVKRLQHGETIQSLMLEALVIPVDQILG